jgi:hypothetical protein
MIAVVVMLRTAMPAMAYRWWLTSSAPEELLHDLGRDTGPQQPGGVAVAEHVRSGANPVLRASRVNKSVTAG